MDDEPGAGESGDGGGTDTRETLCLVSTVVRGVGACSGSLGTGGGARETGDVGTADCCMAGAVWIAGGAGGGGATAGFAGAGTCATGGAIGAGADGRAAGVTGFGAGGGTVAVGRGTAGAVAGGGATVPGSRNPQNARAASVNCNSTYPLADPPVFDFTTWQTTSFFVFSFVRKTSWPGASGVAMRITAPCGKTSTVCVVSENGSRLSDPSTVRAPLTVTGISRGTGCGRVGVSLGDFEAGDAGVVAVVVVVAESVSASFNIGAIEYPLRGD